MRWLAALDEVGFTPAKRDRALGESVLVREGVIRKTQEVQAYWKSIAPVSTRPAHDLHKGGYRDEPGDYQKSIQIRYRKHPSGYLTGQVFTNDPKAHWLEYGSIHNLAPSIGYCQKTVDHFNGGGHNVRA
jgi:hypothetical protein